MADEEHAANDENEQKNADDNLSNDQEPSNAWIWVIAVMLVLIALFFAFGGGRLLGDHASILMVPNTSMRTIGVQSDFLQNHLY